MAGPMTGLAEAVVRRRAGDKWSCMLIGKLGEGPKHFNELRRSVHGISQRILTLTLRGLERDGMIHRMAYPLRVVYELTELGRSLLAQLLVLRAWAMKQDVAIRAAREQFDERQRRSRGRAAVALMSPRGTRRSGGGHRD